MLGIKKLPAFAFGSNNISAEITYICDIFAAPFANEALPIMAIQISAILLLQNKLT